MDPEKTSQAYKQRLGVIVFIVLAVLTAVEFWISLSFTNPGPYLAIIVLVKAGLIIHYFMRLSQLWRREV